MAIIEGEKAPDFSLVDQNGKEHSLNDYSGKYLVIYFYPKDNTPGCNNQACNIRDNYSDIQSNGINILGVSADDETRHQKFIAKFDLPFTLLSDVNKELLNLYGVWGEKKFMGKIYDGIHRTTFILDENHVIISIIEKPKTKDHVSEILNGYNLNLAERN